MEKKSNRREFLATTGAAVAGTLVAPSISFGRAPKAKRKIALIGTGIRGNSMWGKSVVENYSDYVEFVGLCDRNSSRLEFGKKYIGANCKTYTDFEQMMNEQKPEMLIVTTMDSNHHEFIIKGMEMGADIITEKPMTTDERKVQAILDTERSTGKNVTVTFNYRYSPHRQRMYELLREGAIGDVTSVDFHWYLDTSHGASYFRRWHGERENSGTLLVHKSTHHFDLLNWWLESEPEEVFAYGKLDHYGAKGPFRGPNCRSCEHKSDCNYYWDITKSEHDMNLYVAHEEEDGYIRDNCLFRKEINIYDKMAASIRYANDVQVSYSLTTYSPYEGYRIAFNGTGGRLEAWIQESQPWEMQDYDELRLTKNFGDTELIQIPHAGGGHGGGDTRLKDKIFKNPDMEDPYRQSAGSRDGAMSVLLGVAARKSVESGEPVKIGTLTDLKPRPTRL